MKLQRNFVCMEATDSKGLSDLGPGVQCGAWHGEELTWNAAQLTECRACSTGNCSWWGCTSFGTARIIEFSNYEDRDDWMIRFGFGLLHYLWILPITCLVNSCVAAGMQDPLEKLHALLLCFGVWSIWFFFMFSIMLLRREEAEEPYVQDFWRVPFASTGGLIVMCFVSGLATAASARKWQTPEESSSSVCFMSAGVGTATLAGIGMLYRCGILGALPFLFLLGIFVVCVTAAKQSAQRKGSAAQQSYIPEGNVSQGTVVGNTHFPFSQVPPVGESRRPSQTRRPSQNSSSCNFCGVKFA